MSNTLNFDPVFIEQPGDGEQPVQALPRTLVGVAEPDPGGGPRDLGDAYLVDVADEVIIMIPAADPEAGGGTEVQRRRATLGGVGQLAVDVDPRVAGRVGVDDVHPFPGGEGGALDICVREVALHLHVRGAAVVHDHLALPLLIAPG